MRGKSNNIDVASLLFMVLIIIIIVSFLVNPVNIAGAGNWSEEKMEIITPSPKHLQSHL